MEIRRQMSKGLKNRLLKNEKIHSICLGELKNKNRIYAREFTYPESLEFSDNLKVLRSTNLIRIKEVIARIRKHLRANTKGFTEKRIEDAKKRKLDFQIKLDKHLNELRSLRSLESNKKNKEIDNRNLNSQSNDAKNMVKEKDK